MRRVGIAVVLSVIVLLLSGGALLLQYRATTHVTELCDTLISHYENDNMAQCREQARHLSDDLKHDMRWFPFFLKHERMDSIFQQAASLPYLVDDAEAADFYAAVAAIRVQLEILMDNEWPTLENIL